MSSFETAGRLDLGAGARAFVRHRWSQCVFVSTKQKASARRRCCETWSLLLCAELPPTVALQYCYVRTSLFFVCVIEADCFDKSLPHRSSFVCVVCLSLLIISAAFLGTCRSREFCRKRVIFLRNFFETPRGGASKKETERSNQQNTLNEQQTAPFSQTHASLLWTKEGSVLLSCNQQSHQSHQQIRVVSCRRSIKYIQ